VTVSGGASDNFGVSAVQFKLDGANLGPELTNPPASYSITWDTTSTSQGSHMLTAVARDLAGNTTMSAPLPVTVDNTAPTGVAITAPAGGAGVSGTAVIVSSTASDNIGLVGVQFKLDGTNLGGLDKVLPYATTWNTTLTSPGNHTLTAVARDLAGNTTTSAPITVKVDNSSSQ
jgi:hypothetical protein